MKNCKRISGFKPFFKINFSDIKLGSSIFASNILEVLGSDNSPLPFVAKMITKREMTKKELHSEVDIQSYAGLHNLAPKVYDFFICNHGGKEYYTILMEKIEGFTLDQLIEKNGSFPDSLKKSIKSQLDRLYDLGIRHDDMHGGNFLIGKNGEIVIIDFGDVKLYKNKVPQTEREYTIQINVGDLGNVAVGKEDPMVDKIKKEKLVKMKKAVNEAKKKGILIQIQQLQKAIENYKKKGNNMMVKVYEKSIKQKQEQFKKM